MQTLSKDIDTKISTYITTYKAEGGRHDGRTYDKIDELIRKHITYTLYCPKCGNICNWEDETEDHLKRDERPKDWGKSVTAVTWVTPRVCIIAIGIIGLRWERGKEKNKRGIAGNVSLNGRDDWIRTNDLLLPKQAF